jgi:regulator of protease activity HflC (stomatin/prohibitin superfamily)
MVFLLVTAVSLSARGKSAQSGEKLRLAVLPFSGGEGDDGEIIAEWFSGSKDLNEVFRIYPRTSITFGIDEERNVQKYVVSNEEYRNQLLAIGINYVVAGDITRLGRQSVLVISIIDIEKLLQIAGDVQIFEEKQEIEGKLPEMARNIIDGAKINWTDKPKLAVVNPRLRDNADPKAANVLGEILGIEITRTGKYAVYPRNTTLEAVQTEWDMQRRGLTAVADPRGPGNADRPEQVLSVIARGGEGSVTGTRFNASIITDLNTGEQGAFTTQIYRDIEDGITVMRTIAEELTFTDAERKAKEAAESQRARTAEVQRAQEEKEAAEQRAQEEKEAEAQRAQEEREERQAKRERDREERQAERAQKWEDFKEKVSYLLEEEYPRSYWSAGLNLGTGFATPGLTFSPNITIPIAPVVAYLDIGCDFGFFSNADYIKDLSYNSYYPYIRASVFFPFSEYTSDSESKFGFHAGVGYGCMIADYRFGDYDNRTVVSAIDLAIGFLFFNAIDIGYSIRISRGVNHKFSIGLVYRFGAE